MRVGGPGIAHKREPGGVGGRYVRLTVHTQ